MDYIYELRADDGSILATGRLSVEHELQPGDSVPFGAGRAEVVEVRPALGGMTRIVLKLTE